VGNNLVNDKFWQTLSTISKNGSNAYLAFDSLDQLLSISGKNNLVSDKFWKEIVLGHFMQIVSDISMMPRNNAYYVFKALNKLLEAAGNKRIIIYNEFWKAISDICKKRDYMTMEFFNSIYELFFLIRDMWMN